MGADRKVSLSTICVTRTSSASMGSSDAISGLQRTMILQQHEEERKKACARKVAPTR